MFEQKPDYLSAGLLYIQTIIGLMLIDNYIYI